MFLLRNKKKYLLIILITPSYLELWHLKIQLEITTWTVLIFLSNVSHAVLLNLCISVPSKGSWAKGRAIVVKYDIRQPVHRSDTFCLIQADGYRSKNTTV